MIRFFSSLSIWQFVKTYSLHTQKIFRPPQQCTHIGMWCILKQKETSTWIHEFVLTLCIVDTVVNKHVHKHEPTVSVCCLLIPASPPSFSLSPSCNKGYIDLVSKRDPVFPHGPASDMFFLAGRTSTFVIHSAYFNKLETLETRITAMFWFGFETLTVPTIIFQNTGELFDSHVE